MLGLSNLREYVSSRYPTAGGVMTGNSIEVNIGKVEVAVPNV